MCLNDFLNQCFRVHIHIQSHIMSVTLFQKNNSGINDLRKLFQGDKMSA